MENTTHKKKWYKRWWIWVVIAIFVIGILSPSKDVAEEEVEEEIQEVIEENDEEIEELQEELEEVDEVTDISSQLVESTNTFDQEFLEDMALNIMEDNLSSQAEIDLNRELKVFTITPTDPQFTQALVMVAEGVNGEDDWNFMVYSLSDLSESMTELLGEGYSLSLINPANPEKQLLLLSDGQVLYDVFNE